MRRVREVLRLVLGEGLSRRQAAASLGMPFSTVNGYVARAMAAGLGWPLPAELDERALEARLFRQAAMTQGQVRPRPDWAEVHAELRRKGVTLQLLWMEYKQRAPDGYQYTQFVHHYRRWAGRLDVVLRQEHRAGEKLFLDFAGQTLPITDPGTGLVSPAELFVAVLGASNLTYAEAVPSQELPHWIAANVHAFEFAEGVPEILVPDNLRSGVTKAHRYEPLLNATYQEMAAHYGCVIIPARSRKPRDKAKVEAGVLLAERWILASLRNRTFFSIAEANLAIRERLQWLNDRPFQKLEGSRRSLFELLERPALRPLPARPYEYATWKTATVNIDYHVEVDRHYYSVPYQLTRQRCDVRLTASTVEMLFRGRRVASHRRSFRRGGHTTLAEHMPESHRRHLEWTPSRIVRWAQNSGPNTVALVDEIMRSRPHPEQGYRSCLGILRLGKRYGGDRLEAACARAVALRAFSYRSVESILRSGLDRQPLLPIAAATPTTPRQHDHVRGADYYQ
jgi:transposase